MPTRTRTRRPPREQTRQDLLEAAARVFARKGFHGASVEAVSEEAGYSTGALYSNFAGKEDLFLSLYEERIDRRRRELRESVNRAGGRAAGLEAAAASMREVFSRERDWFLLYFEFSLHAARDPAFARRFEVVREEGLAQVVAGLEVALARRGSKSSMRTEHLAQAIRAISYGLALDRLIAEDSVPMTLPGEVFALLFRGLDLDASRDRENEDQS